MAHVALKKRLRLRRTRRTQRTTETRTRTEPASPTSRFTPSASPNLSPQEHQITSKGSRGTTGMSKRVTRIHLSQSVPLAQRRRRQLQCWKIQKHRWSRRCDRRWDLPGEQPSRLSAAGGAADVCAELGLRATPSWVIHVSLAAGEPAIGRLVLTFEVTTRKATSKVSGHKKCHLMISQKPTFGSTLASDRSRRDCMARGWYCPGRGRSSGSRSALPTGLLSHDGQEDNGLTELICVVRQPQVID